MRIAVVGAGAAGLTAAYRLTQAGHAVTVFEARPFVGGRTHTEHFGPGHHLDTGAGWLTSAYSRTFALLEELGLRDCVHPMRASAPAELLVNGAPYTSTGKPRTAGDGAGLIPAAEQKPLREWLRSLASHPGDLSTQLAYDLESAEDHLAKVSPAAARYVFAPMFEGLFAPLREHSAEFLRSWVASGRVTYWQLDDGMDAPWKKLAHQLDVRLEEPVLSIRRAIGGVEVVSTASSGLFDGVVLAAPPPVARHAVEPALLPTWYEDIRYSGQCRLYASRAATSHCPPVHIRPLPMGLVASVEWQSGGDGAWGCCPDGQEWVLVCANEAQNEDLLALPPALLRNRLWDAAAELLPGLFPLSDAEHVHLIRWEHAVPVMLPGHFTRMSGYRPQPPVVLAGDWTHQACVEGAVRSGEAAAAAFA